MQGHYSFQYYLSSSENPELSAECEFYGLTSLFLDVIGFLTFEFFQIRYTELTAVKMKKVYDCDIALSGLIIFG